MILSQRSSRRACLAILAGGALAPRGALAAGLQFSPTLIDLAPSQRTATLEVINRSAQVTAVQVRTFAWAQSGGGAGGAAGGQDDALAATGDLAASPPVFSLPPGETQLVRIVLRTPVAAGNERAFRLLIDEIPPPGQPGGVQLALRISLPVFAAAPDRTAADLRWTLQPAGSGWEIVANNRGTRRARVGELSATGPGGRQLTAAPLDQNPWVLGGGRRRWRLADPSRVIWPGATVRLAGTLETGALEAVVMARG